MALDRFLVFDDSRLPSKPESLGGYIRTWSSYLRSPSGGGRIAEADINMWILFNVFEFVSYVIWKKGKSQLGAFAGYEFTNNSDIDPFFAQKNWPLTFHWVHCPRMQVSICTADSQHGGLSGQDDLWTFAKYENARPGAKKSNHSLFSLEDLYCCPPPRRCKDQEVQERSLLQKLSGERKKNTSRWIPVEQQHVTSTCTSDISDMATFLAG